MAWNNFYITLATLIWQFISKIGNFNWLWKLHGHLPKLKWQFLKIKLCSKLVDLFLRFQDWVRLYMFWYSQFLESPLAHLNWDDLNMKVPPHARNLWMVISQHEKCHWKNNIRSLGLSLGFGRFFV